MLRVEQNYVSGIPQTAVSGWAPRGLAWHWTAGGTGRAGAEATIRHFINTRTTVNASYHILFWVEHAASHTNCVTYAMWIVPSSKASHSMNPSQAFQPKSGSAREQARFTEVHRILGRDSDPNADCWSLSYCGMPANLAEDVKCPVFIADLRNLAGQLIAHPSWIISNPHFGHGWIQPYSRYEMDTTPEGIDLLIGRLYGVDPEPPEEEMIFWLPVQQDWHTVAKTDTALGTVFYDGAGAKKEFTSVERVRSIAESSDGRWRLVKYGSNELLVVDARTSAREGAGLNPVTGTRIPATGFGFPPPEVKEVIKEVIKEVPTGITQEQVDLARTEGVTAGVTSEKTRIREFLGL